MDYDDDCLDYRIYQIKCEMMKIKGKLFDFGSATQIFNSSSGPNLDD